MMMYSRIRSVGANIKCVARLFCSSSGTTSNGAPGAAGGGIIVVVGLHLSEIGQRVLDSGRDEEEASSEAEVDEGGRSRRREVRADQEEAPRIEASHFLRGGWANVHFTLFGKANIADIDVNEIDLETRLARNERAPEAWDVNMQVLEAKAEAKSLSVHCFQFLVLIFASNSWLLFVGT
ncbi:hypothetical protein VNO80_07685 [Phaseolus coccineus]|uniref:Uncharacterized protein n=1 Tax=Phaseolus coccineus TaxID=3886 RepID=A0AAN9NNW4_PHACN